MDDYTISTDKNKLDTVAIHDFLCYRSYWAQGRTLETVTRAITHSLCFGVYDGAGRFCGFARVVTDYAIFAYIMDVFVLETDRKKGLGKLLMEAIVSHPDLHGLQRVMLATNDAHGLYEQYGFRPTAIPEKLMEIVRKA
jgi:GNAT superfamily N-acetyltransferase